MERRRRTAASDRITPKYQRLGAPPPPLDGAGPEEEPPLELLDDEELEELEDELLDEDELEELLLLEEDELEPPEPTVRSYDEVTTYSPDAVPMTTE